MQLASKLIATLLFVSLASTQVLDTWEDTEFCFEWASVYGGTWDGIDSISVTADFGTFEQEGDALLGEWCFMPNTNIFGSYMTSVQTCIEAEGCSEYPLTVNIYPVNDEPVAIDDEAFMGCEDLSIEVDVICNDMDVDSPVDYRTVEITNAFGPGAEVTCTGKIKWTRPNRMAASNTIEYKICDPYPPYSCDTADVYIEAAEGCDACQDCNEYMEAHVYHTETVDEIFHEVTSM